MTFQSPPSFAELVKAGHAGRLHLPTLRGQSADALPRTVTIRPPGSKSLTNRALLLAGLASGQSTLRNALIDADDAQRMMQALTQLGARIEVQAGSSDVSHTSTIWVEGVGGRWRVKGTPTQDSPLFLNNAGTATRFLTAAAALADAPVTIDGNARMRQRPIAELVESLLECGVQVEYLERQGFVPLRVHPLAKSGGLRVRQRTTQSSQFLSALLMLGPFLPSGMTLILEGEITSASYVQMTVDLLAQLGANVQTASDLRVIRVSPSDSVHASDVSQGAGLKAFDLAIEPDASGATYFWGAATLVPGLTCHVQGIGPRSLQGDARFAGLLARMGASLNTNDADDDRLAGHSSARMQSEPWTSVTGKEGKILPVLVDMSDMPDAAMTLAAVAAFASGTSILRGLRTLRAKETDRIAALQNELAKVGVKVVTPVADDEDAITITPPEGGIDCSANCPVVEFDTYDDHRMAMSMALLSLRRPNCVIKDPACVAKTYPTFWDDWWKLLSPASCEQ